MFDQIMFNDFTSPYKEYIKIENFADIPNKLNEYLAIYNSRNPAR